jgi:hypothetical protein
MPIRARIAAVEMFASSGWIVCENTSLVSQAGCFDASIPSTLARAVYG